MAERLPQTRAVIEEAIRLYPPIAAISRVAVDRDNLNEETVKPGSLIVCYSRALISVRVPFATRTGAISPSSQSCS
ncbi:hypothetical protein [Bradyrhizobium lablabi]|uniref:hypothetical protein n=1 Tax=Bradyrhizobium lablabi TaxID=722472 RepID=UPI0012AC3FB3|nr:hypothetical protein [Bradyrhizobium lablabi]